MELKYWGVLKTHLKAEGSQLATNCSQLKLESSDGKFYKTDVADTEQLLRLIQSIPSKKAEPFKAWLEKVGVKGDMECFSHKKAKIYKHISTINSKMIPSDPTGLLDESFFNSFKIRGFN